MAESFQDVTQSHDSGESIRDVEHPFVGRSGNVVVDCPYASGDRLGRYQVVRILGTGGFGHVVEAFDPKLQRTVAIKFPRIDPLRELGDTFLEKARSVARLDHPSIVRIYNVEESADGLPLAVMEFVPGPTLHQLIREGGLTWASAMRYLIQISSALSYAHEQSLIHRDVKPANVLIASVNDTARLSDFGMALHDLTPEHSLGDRPQGTPPYMSPEQVRGENHRLDCRSDIWALGVMMYVMFTGKKPFPGPGINDLVDQICHRDPTPPREWNPEIPDDLERICLRCLEKLARSRYGCASELLDDLSALEYGWFHVDATTQSDMPLIAGRDSGFNLHSSVANPRDDTGNSVNSARSFGTEYQLVPRGLRSFDADDTDFFVAL